MQGNLDLREEETAVSYGRLSVYFCLISFVCNGAVREGGCSCALEGLLVKRAVQNKQNAIRAVFRGIIKYKRGGG